MSANEDVSQRLIYCEQSAPPYFTISTKARDAAAEYRFVLNRLQERFARVMERTVPRYTIDPRTFKVLEARYDSRIVAKVRELEAEHQQMHDYFVARYPEYVQPCVISYGLKGYDEP